MTVLRIQPVSAFLLLNVALVLAMTTTSVLFSHPQIPMSNIGAVIVILGWMTLFVTGYGRNSKYGSTRTSIVTIVAYLCAIVVHVFLVPLSFELSLEPQSLVRALLLSLTAIFGMGCPLVIMSAATRLLMFEEEGGRVSIDRCVGTFLAFFFLPIGIIFLQKRVRAVVLARIDALRPR